MALIQMVVDIGKCKKDSYVCCCRQAAFIIHILLCALFAGDEIDKNKAKKFAKQPASKAKKVIMQAKGVF